MSANDKPKPSKRGTARERIAEKRAAEAAARARAERRRKTIIGGVTAAVLVVVAVVLVVIVQTQRTTVSPHTAAPAHASGTAKTEFVIGKSDAPIRLDLYEDFLCPNCATFEKENGATVDRLIADGKARLVYHGMAFLDTAANEQYSTRALNAAAAVAAHAGTDAMWQFHHLLYAHQPPESGPGLSDQQLIGYAEQAGASSAAVKNDITGLVYRDWTKKATDQASRDGVTGTPTVMVNGRVVQDWRAANFNAALQAVQGG